MRVTISLTLLPMLLAAGCDKPPAARPAAPPAPVTVAVAVKKTVPVQVRTIGSVKPLATVAIRPRVGGQLTGVFFKEGENVKKDQKLFTIDPVPYAAAVKLAEANRAKSAAPLRGAELELARLERVGNAGVAGGELDIARTAVASGKAAVAADEAAIASAKVQLEFTTISSPIDGRVGELLVSQGNLVDANGVNPLAVVNQISPITVTFALPEPQLPAVAAARRERGPLGVEAYLRDGQPPIAGKLVFIDNAVNAGSGTVQLKAEFPNLDRKLWPGQFVDVVLTIQDRPDSVVVPAAAVQSGQKGSFVFLVKPDRTVEMRAVTVAFETGGEAVVATGLTGGERVVVEGQLRLVAGAAVDVKGDPAPQPARSEPSTASTRR